MKITYYIIIGFTCLFIFYLMQNNEKNISHNEKIFNNTTNQITKNLEKKYKMSIASKGGSEKNEKLSFLTLSFTRKQGPLAKEEARKMILDCVKEYIDGINQNEEIIPYLENSPFTNNNINLIIINYQKNGDSLKDPDIKVIASYNNKIYFKTEDPFDKFSYKQVESENYLDALEIVKKENDLSDHFL